MPTEEMTYRQNIDTKLDEILKQVKYTNGRVGRLENWRWFISGGLAIITVLVVPILFIVIQHFL